jgi:competence protein ComEC
VLFAACSPHSPAPWLLGGLLGVALQLQQPELAAWPVYSGACAAAGLGMVALRWRLRRWLASRVAMRAMLALLAFVLALVIGWGTTGWRASVFAAQALTPSLEGPDLVLTGWVRGLPQPGPEMVRFRLEVESATLNGEAVKLPRHVQLGWYAPRQGAAMQAGDSSESARAPAQLAPGERWRMTVRLKAPHGAHNPHGFDQELWLWVHGVQAVGYVRNGWRDAAPVRLAGGGWSVDSLRQAVRTAIYAQVQGPMAGVVVALVMGDQAAIERSDWDVFRATGVAHLMSISGLHITLFAWLAAALLRALWRGSARWTPAWCLWLPAHRAGAWGGLLLATLYAVFSGWGLPAQRTIWMLAVGVLLQHGSWRWPWQQVWLLAMAVVVAVDPWALMQAGFWLSFVAVGVLLATDQKRRDTPQAAPGRPVGVRLWQGAVGLMREQILIMLALAPLSLLMFGQVSVVGLVANAFAIPWVTWVVTPLALLGTAWAPLWSVAAVLLEALMAALSVLADWPWAVWSRPAAPLWCGVAGVLGALVLVIRWPWYVRVLGLPLVLPVLLWSPPRPAAGQVELLALDVGQGSAVLVRTAHHSLLYDAGPRYSRESDAGHSVLVPALRALGVRLDMLVLSHEDSDHVGGAQAVRDSQPQVQVRASFARAPGLQATGLQLCEAGQRWLWDGVEFEFLHPQAHMLAQLRTSNARSCVLRVRSSGAVPATALLTGDLEAAQEQALLQREQVQADWLLVPHHGSKTSSSPAFVQAVQPRLAVVQAGYRNRFGHPAPEVQARYVQQGVQLVKTTECGAATWRSTQPGQVECLREQGRRYWHHRGATELAR